MAPGKHVLADRVDDPRRRPEVHAERDYLASATPTSARWDIVAGDDGTARLTRSVKLHRSSFPGDRGGSGSAERRRREEQKVGFQGATRTHMSGRFAQECVPPKGG